MEKDRFPNPRLDLPEEFKNSKDESTIKSFDAIENYLELIGDCIYTDISLDYFPTDQNHIHAWIQRIVSAHLLRSLYIRNAFVEAFNSRNHAGFYLPLKAWFEVIGVLASILNMLEKQLTPEEMFEKMKPYALGNKGKGDLRVGEIEAKNVMDMIREADKYIQKMVESSSKAGTGKGDNYFTNFYDIASNPSHPSFDAMEVVGGLIDNGVWRAKTPEEIEKGIVETLPQYGGLLVTPLFIRNIAEKIFKIEAEHFEKLGSKKYFD